MPRILRTWTFWIRTVCEDECRAYLDRHNLPLIRAQPGCLHARAIFRPFGDSATEVVVASVWRSMADIRAYTGRGDPMRPRGDPLAVLRTMDREPYVRHSLIRTDEEADALLGSLS